MNGAHILQERPPRPWTLHPGAAVRSRITRIQNPQRPRRETVVGHCRAVRWHEQRAAAGWLEVHERGQGLAVPGHAGQSPGCPSRAQPDIPHQARKNAKPFELVCLHLVASGSRSRYGCRPAVPSARGVQPLESRVAKHFDVHGSRVNSTHYKHGRRVWEVPISTVAVSIWGHHHHSLDTVAVHYLDKPSAQVKKAGNTHEGQRRPAARVRVMSGVQQ